MVDASANHPIRSYTEFWSFYLREHSRPETRSLHYFGTAAAVLAILAALATGRLWIALFALVAGYRTRLGGTFFRGKEPSGNLFLPNMVNRLRLPDGVVLGDRTSWRRAGSSGGHPRASLTHH